MWDAACSQWACRVESHPFPRGKQKWNEKGAQEEHPVHLTRGWEGKGKGKRKEREREMPPGLAIGYVQIRISALGQNIKHGGACMGSQIVSKLVDLIILLVDDVPNDSSQIL